MKFVGKSIIRTDAVEKVTGQAKYIGDMKFPNMVYGKILRSPHPHARIISLNTEKAEKMPHVLKVITGGSSEVRYGFCIEDRVLMAVDKVRYEGEPVAAVIGTSNKIAEKALKEISVEYEILPHVTDPLQAVSFHAPMVHKNHYKYSRIPAFFPKKGTNIFHHYKLRKGNIKKGDFKIKLRIGR